VATPSWKLKVSAIGISLLAALCLLEVFVRVLPASQRLLTYPSAIPGVGYQIVPNSTVSEGGSRIKINRWGFRGEEFPEAKPEGEQRVVVLGDSVAYGQGVAEAPFPGRLAAQLGSPYKVINTAVPSYGTCQQWALLRGGLERFSPDAIVIAYVMNDPEGARTPFGLDLQSGKIGGHYRLYHWVKRNIRLVRYVMAKLAPLITRLRGRTYYAPAADPLDTVAYTETLHEPQSPFWQKAAECLVAMGTYGLKKDRAIVLVLLPLIDKPRELRLEKVYAQVQKTAEGAGIAVLNLAPALSNLTPQQRASMHIDGVHLSAKGHAYVAAKLGVFIKNK
jgi:lysophospholipase L1-like esterase